MADTAPQAGEPTMEEILASIRRIISEEEAEAVPAPTATIEPRPEPEEEILELTDIVEPEPEPVFRPRPTLVEPAADIAFEEAPEPDSSHLIADIVADQAKAAFDLLHRDMPVAHTAPQVSLEAIVRELLKPLLKQWLDTHLTDIVEKIVREEVERVANRRR